MTSQNPEPSKKKENASKTASNQGNPAAFFYKHNRLLTFAGGLLVFTTFIVKEGLRESLKDLVDSIRAAQTLFVIRADSHKTMESLDDLHRGLEVIRITTIPANRRKTSQVRESGFRTGPEEQTPDHKNAATASTSADDMTSMLADQIAGHTVVMTSAEDQFVSTRRYLNDNIAALVKQLPSRDADTATLKQLSNGLTAVIDEINNAKSTLDQLRCANMSTEELLDKEQVMIGVSHDIATEEIDLMELSDFERHVFQEAQQEREKSELRYRWSTWATYLLYALGWGVGLVARFYGFHENSEDE